jgi:hypothetical protein
MADPNPADEQEISISIISAEEIAIHYPEKPLSNTLFRQCHAIVPRQIQTIGCERCSR